VEERVKTVPGVQAASFSFFIFNQGQWTGPVFTRDQTPPVEQSRVVRKNVVGQDYFNTMGIPLLLGRAFGPQDSDKSQKVAVISEMMAQRFFPNTSPLGRHFGTNGPESKDENEIIGVVRNTKYATLRDEVPPESFGVASQFPGGRSWMSVFVCTSSPPAAMISALREKISQVNPEIRVEFRVFQKDIENGLIRERMMATLSGFFGVLAALLTAIGLYGVMSYSMSRRTSEIGIRMALGASRREVLRLVLQEGLSVTLLGVTLGLAGALLLSRIMAGYVYGITSTDPLTFAVASLLLTLVALLASYFPARRAANVDPLVALRYE